MTDLIQRLRKRAEIRRQIPGRKSVANGEPDRIADILEEAANRIEEVETAYIEVLALAESWMNDYDKLKNKYEPMIAVISEEAAAGRASDSTPLASAKGEE